MFPKRPVEVMARIRDVVPRCTMAQQSRCRRCSRRRGRRWQRASRPSLMFTMKTNRRCSRPGCTRTAVATLTYVYAESTAVLGPLATYAEPHCYDLCSNHSERLTAPRGWELVRLEPDPAALLPSHSDLEALADLVRNAAAQAQSVEPQAEQQVGRRGHLRVIRNDDYTS
ncbi:MAG: hypothetical protein RL745_176 [Actinomycetota bacterium]|jgi:hypothetical protein